MSAEDRYTIRIYRAGLGNTPPRLLEMTEVLGAEQGKAFVWDRLTNPRHYQGQGVDSSWRICNVAITDVPTKEPTL